MLSNREREAIEHMANAMRDYDDAHQGEEKTWRDLASVAYNAYVHYREYELVMRVNGH